MIDPGRANHIFILACILLLHYAPLIEVALCGGLIAYRSFVPHPPSSSIVIATYAAAGLLTLEIAYYFVVYGRHKARLVRQAKYPEPLDSAERKALFQRCLANITDGERYLRWWFLGAEARDIKRENVKEFFLWAFFDTDGNYHDTVPGVTNGGNDEDASDIKEEVEVFLDLTEKMLGRELPPGRGSAQSFRLTIDAVETRYRTVIWYAIVGLVDFGSHVRLVLNGFRYYAPSLRKTLTVIPPRIPALPSWLPALGMKKHRSDSGEIGYWLRPHTSKTRLPIVFLHGIGIGMWPYINFLAEMNARKDDGEDGQIGILALEILPISMRLTSTPLPQAQFLAHLTTILGQHAPDWDEFVLVSHSYGSVLTTHILRSPDLGPRVKGVVLLDPVSILLHLPDVAYNFTRRQPRTANEWQLWFFASMDLGIAEGLGRHFFWRENIIWREDLVNLHTQYKSSSDLPYSDAGLTNGKISDRDIANGGTANGIKPNGEATNGGIVNGASENGHREDGGERKRQVAVVLSGRDLIVDTRAVARYLTSESDLGDVPEDLSEYVALVGSKQTDQRTTYRTHVAPSGMSISWFPLMDHSQIFEHRASRNHLTELLRKITLDDM